MASDKALSWVFAEEFVEENDILAQARETATDLGAEPVSTGVGATLRLLAATCGAKAVLEIGTGAGVSGLWLLQGMSADGVLTTIDHEVEFHKYARRAFTAAGIPSQRTRLIAGRALDVLPRMAARGYDMMVIDAPADEIPDYLDHALRVLRPGGLALSTWALKRAVLPGADVVEFAPGLGVTARAIIGVGPGSYTGVERDPDACARVDAIASGVGRCVNADAAETGLPDESADVVVGEAMLSMQGEKAKRAIMGEAARILRPGGRYVIHELAVRPDSIGEEPATKIRKALARAISVNARPLTVADWRRALEEVGLIVEETRMAPMALLKPGRMIADEGVRGALRVARNVVRDKDLRGRVATMARTFKKYDRNLCGVAIVARKPKENE